MPLDLGAVVAGRLAGQVVAQTFEPLLGRFLALVGDHGGEQGDIVDVLAAAGADASLPLGIGKLVVGDGILLDAILGGVDHAGTGRHANPVALGITVLRGDVLVHHLGFDRLGDAELLGAVEAADVDREQDVGRRILAFRLNALAETARGEDHVGLDARFLGERLQQRLDEERLAIGIDVHLAVGEGRRGANGGKHEARDQGLAGLVEEACHHCLHTIRGQDPDVGGNS